MQVKGIWWVFCKFHSAFASRKRGEEKLYWTLESLTADHWEFYSELLNFTADIAEALARLRGRMLWFLPLKRKKRDLTCSLLNSLFSITLCNLFCWIAVHRLFPEKTISH